MTQLIPSLLRQRAFIPAVLRRSCTASRIGFYKKCYHPNVYFGTMTSKKMCNIIVVGREDDAALSELAHLGQDCKVQGIGSSLDEFRLKNIDLASCNVLLNATGNASVIAPLLHNMPNVEWIHSMLAGVDTLMCPEIVDNDKITVTNAKGVFSSSLAEYTIFACLYFAKQVPRLLSQQASHAWTPFCVSEVSGKVMGIIGYGDIGQAAGRLGKAFGMHIHALRRRPELSKDDPVVDALYDMSGLLELLSVSDYVVVVTPLTPETRNLLSHAQFQAMKPSAVLINIGRGPVVDESALIEALQRNTIAGAALDVFSTEPLPAESPLWEMKNVLISPHCADMTETFRHESCRFFVENTETFLRGESFTAVVNKKLGY